MMPFMEPPSPEQIEAMKAQQALAVEFQRELMRLEISQRRDILGWPMLFCTCRENWRSALGSGGMPLQMGCIVHGQFTASEDGKVIM